MTKSEALTRSELIDQKLAWSGWNVKDPTQVVEEFDILTGLPDGVAEAINSSMGMQSPSKTHEYLAHALQVAQAIFIVRKHGSRLSPRRSPQKNQACFPAGLVLSLYSFIHLTK